MSTKLQNKLIVLTREKNKNEKIVSELEELGANVVMLPTIKITPIEDYTEFDSALKEIPFDFVIFPSANSVEVYSKRMKLLGMYDKMSEVKKICVGTKTKEVCEKLDIYIDLLPRVFSAKGVLQLLDDFDLKNKNVLLPSSTIARTELGDGLIKRGATLYNLPVYNVVLPEKEELHDELEKIKENKPDTIVFSSPSTFHNYLQLLGIDDVKTYFSNIDIAAIGSTTKESIEERGLEVKIVPNTFTMPALIEAVKDFYK